MSILGDVFQSIVGRIHFRVYLGKAPAAEIEIVDKDIIVHILNPIVAIELGIHQILSGEINHEFDSLQHVKDMGYKIKIKYKGLEFDL